ncbi:FCPE, partial [Symbiodinium sp. CCMP2456]
MQATIVARNAAVSACEKGSHWQGALQLLREAEEGTLQANAITYNSACSALEKARRWQQALQLLAQLRQRGLEATLISYCAAIGACARGENWQGAIELLLELRDEAEVLGDDTTAFVSAIGACEQRQLHQEAQRTMALLEGGAKLNSCLAACLRPSTLKSIFSSTTFVAPVLARQMKCGPTYLGGKSIEDPELKKKKLNAELANGRLAMMAIIGMFFQDGLTGSAWGDWANYTDSPLRAFENELGVQAPLGYFDPLGLSKDGDVETFRRRRESELKNGRVAMFATIGYMVPEYFKFPGYLAPSANLKFADVPNGLAAITKVPAEGWLQWVALCGCYEWVVNEPVDPAEPGNYGKGKLGYGNMVLGITAESISDADARKRGLNSELANGRLAMMAIVGLWVQDGLFGTPYGLYTGSSAFENELGVQAPLGYFDPLGLSKDGDVETFRRRRESEIKNGRVAMFATMGYMVPEYFKFPGYLAPSANLKFADVPNGLAAITKVPAEGWLQWVALCGCYEWVVNEPVDPAEPGNYGKGKLGYGNMVLGITAESISDPESRKRGLNSELANGRLAMMAIVGLWVQDGLFGTPYGLYQGSSAFETELGVQPPAGFWDPLGFTKGGDAASFRRRRYVELKHGRVAMLACMGYIVPEYYRWPGDLSPSLGLKFTDVPTGFAAFSKVPLSGWAQMVAFAGSVELFQYVDDPKRAPGDFENAGLLGIPNGFMKAPEGQKEKKLAAEIANGRLAMMAIIGMFFQNGLTGQAWGDWSLYTDSPLRAFETELGVQPPAGFWDPLGFTKGGDAASFRRRRYVELKHGRVAMLACMGYIVPEYYRWPGDLSPSLGLKFTDVPTGFAAFSKVPLSGWAQMVAFAGSVELFQYVDDPKRAPGDFENAGLLGIPNGFMKAPEGQKEKKLAAEIANGRLAMMAIIGMFFQNGLTGQAWGDWSLYTDSPLRALTAAQELIAGTGGPLPNDFWDPAGLSTRVSEKELLNYRAMELKHGRVAMLAVLHWFHVAAGYHLLGDYAIGEKMSNDPLVSLTQLPMGGMWQVIFTIMCLEWLTTYICKPPEDRPWDVLGWKGIIDEDYPSEIWNGWKRVQCQEVNNGRLAMMAITGLIAQ